MAWQAFSLPDEPCSSLSSLIEGICESNDMEEGLAVADATACGTEVTQPLASLGALTTAEAEPCGEGACLYAMLSIIASCAIGFDVRSFVSAATASQSCSRAHQARTP